MKVAPSPHLAQAARIYARQAAAAARPEAVSGDIRPVDAVMGIPLEEMTPKVKAALHSLMREVESLRADLEKTRRRADHLERLADEDVLLPVVNRRAFVRELTRVIAFAQRYGSPSSVIYFDVNGMKQVNDNLGHAAGDAALGHVAETLLGNVRQSDVVGRLGGDEFGVILEQADEDTVTRKAAALADVVRATPVRWHGQDISVSLAYGHYTFRNEDDAGTALAKADEAMYVRKRGLR